MEPLEFKGESGLFAIEDLEPVSPGLVKGLRGRTAYQSDPSARHGVEEIQTHISYVFLTRDRVYKFRKAVDLGFLDFRRRSERAKDCLREVALNRRLAPDVYLGVAVAQLEGKRVRVGSVGEVLDERQLTEDCEPCVVMRRLPDHRDAHSLLEAGQLRAEHIDRMAACIATFHSAHRIRIPKRLDAEAWLSRLASPVRDCLEEIERVSGSLVSKRSYREVHARVEAFLVEHASDFEARRLAGCFVDGHGDVHLGHCWFERDDSQPIFIDCIEFREDLRHIDPAAEIAFPAMDLFYRRRPGFADRFLRRYASYSDDFELYRVVDFFMAYRALVRAKVAAIVACAQEIEASQRKRSAGSARRHLGLALRVLTREARPGLVVVSGIVGTGKSSVAEVAADAFGGVVIGSDRVRKHMVGLEPTMHPNAPWRAGIYSLEQTDAVYAGLLTRAEPIVASGRQAVLDATFAQQHRRDEVIRFARTRGLPVVFLELQCPDATVLRRLERRQRDGRDPSDAGPDLYFKSKKAYEAVTLPETVKHMVVQTGARNWRGALRRLLLAVEAA